MLLSPTKRIDTGDGAPCGGYFDGSTLAVACGKRDWLQVLAHEYCHLLQWARRAPVWGATKRSDAWYWDWVAGKGRPRAPAVTRRASARYVDLELDCERATVRMLRALGLMGAAEERRYVRGANAYLLWYTFMGRCGVWYAAGRSPYRVPAILAAVPDRFMPRAWYDRLPPAYAHLAFQHCLTPQRRRRAWRRLLAAA